MKNTKPTLGHLGSKFFSLMQVRHQTLIRLGELEYLLGLTPNQEQALLKRLANNGYLFRLQKGVYLIPKTLPAGGPWRPNDYHIITQYMRMLNAKYYLSGLTALHYHGLTEQIPNQFTVYNNKRSGKKQFGKLTITFIKVQSKKIVGFTEVSIPNHGTINMATLPKTLLDLIQDWSRHKLLPKAYDCLEQFFKDDKFLKELIQLAAQHANKSTVRRLGYYLEKLGVNSRRLTVLNKRLGALNGWTVLYPHVDSKGATNKKWRIIDNAK